MAYLIQTDHGQTGAKYQIHKARVSIGRSPACDIYLDDPSVSHQHAMVSVRANSDDTEELNNFSLEDIGSTNGTYVNNQRVDQVTLHHNDNIVIGLSNFRFIDEQQIAMEHTQAIKKSWIPGVFYLKHKN